MFANTDIGLGLSHAQGHQGPFKQTKGVRVTTRGQGCGFFKPQTLMILLFKRQRYDLVQRDT